jgi:ubiquinone/menaquinone biosynthesis C-methylase UbiE
MSSTNTFRGFELAGWSDEDVCEIYHEHFGSVTIQSVPALIDAAQVAHNSRVLDVCCGAGYAAALAAERGAEVVGVDFAQSQIDLATKVYPEVAFEVGDATALRFDDGSFDCGVNGIGMPHFEDPDAAISESFRVLRDGGRFAFSVYASPEQAVGFNLLYSAVQEHGTMNINLPEGPNFFTFSNEDESRRRVEGAGFQDFKSELIPQTWKLSSTDEFLEAVKQGSVRAAATLRGQESSAIPKIEASITKGLERYRVGDGYEVPMPAIVVSARRPHS